LKAIAICNPNCHIGKAFRPKFQTKNNIEESLVALLVKKKSFNSQRFKKPVGKLVQRFNGSTIQFGILRGPGSGLNQVHSENGDLAGSTGTGGWVDPKIFLDFWINYINIYTNIRIRVIWLNDLDLIKPKTDVKTDRDNEFSDRNVDFSRRNCSLETSLSLAWGVDTAVMGWRYGGLK